MQLKLLQIIILTVCLSAGLVRAESSQWNYASTFTWESKYVENGRNELSEGGIFTAEFVAQYEAVSLAAWSVLGDSVDYKEIQLTAAYGFEWRHIELSAGWTHLEFDPAEGDDDELFFEAARILPYDLQFTVSGVYSFVADGSFVELALSYPCSYLENRLLLEPYVLQGIDFGYRTEEYDGWSNYQIGVDLSYVLSDRVTFIAFLAHSFAQEDVAREGLGDVSWGGFGLSADF